MGHKKLTIVQAVFSALLTFLFPVVGGSQEPFYKGKTITIIYGGGPGGTADMRTRAVASFLSKYIPGNPAIVIDYMPGGGGRKAGNHIYKARPDGLSIGSMLSGFIPAPVLGTTGVLYDIHEVIYLGSPISGNPYVFLTHREAGLHTVERLRVTPGVRIAAQSVGHVHYYTGRTFAYLIGMKEPRFVTGYSTGREIDLAVLRREADARVNTPDTLIELFPDWFEGLMDFHAMIEIPKGRKHPHPHLAQLPDLETFARSDRERKLLTMLRALVMTGNPLVLPPGTPKERVQILQEAMRKTFKDPEFYREFKKLAAHDATPLMPDELEHVIKELPRDPDVIDLLKKIAGPDPLPLR